MLGGFPELLMYEQYFYVFMIINVVLNSNYYTKFLMLYFIGQIEF
jgi:hypothetical protein